MLERIRQPASWPQRLAEIDSGIAGYLDILDPMLAADTGPVRLDRGGQLHLTSLAAEVLPDYVDPERNRLARRLPLLHLPELLTQTDNRAHFTNELTHASGASPRNDPTRHRQVLFAAVMAQACNLGITRMAALSGISIDTLEHYTRWYLREDTLRAANNAIIDTHHRHQLAAVWGGGTLSSSDGLRLPMEGQSVTARTLKGYFVDEGITSYLHVSDQHTTYGTQIIVSTDRDATYTLEMRSSATPPNSPSTNTPSTPTAKHSPRSPCSTSAATDSHRESRNSPSDTLQTWLWLQPGCPRRCGARDSGITARG